MADSRPRGDERRAAAEDLARRLDPDDTMRQAEQMAGFIDNPLVRPVLLSLLEGVVRDVTDNRHTPYRRGEADLLYDVTLAGYREGLPVLDRLRGAKQDDTAATGQLRRNGVLHGRELASTTARTPPRPSWLSQPSLNGRNPSRPHGCGPSKRSWRHATQAATRSIKMDDGLTDAASRT